MKARVLAPMAVACAFAWSSHAHAQQVPQHDPRAHPAHDETLHSLVLFDRLEAFGGDHAGEQWSARGWIGGDVQKLWLRSEGERTQGRTKAADVEVLYGRAIAPWWDVVAGVRHDFKPGASRDFVALGLVGVAPYKIDVQATALAGQDGQFGTRIELEYEALVTNRLVLQPLLEVEAWGRDDAARGIGSGLSHVEGGLRMRYEVTRRFAPYVGLVREWSFGGTADHLRATGNAPHDTRVVAGVRAWF